MGAEFQTYKVKAKDKASLKKAIKQLIKDAQYEHGHGGYTGTIAESNGEVETPNLPISSYKFAEEYILEHAKKWEASIAIRLEGPGLFWLVGGWYSC